MTCTSAWQPGRRGRVWAWGRGRCRSVTRSNWPRVGSREGPKRGTGRRRGGGRAVRRPAVRVGVCAGARGPSPTYTAAAHLGCSAGGRQARRSDATCGHFPLYVERCQPAARARRGQCVCHTRDTSERTSKGAKGHSKGHALLSRQTERQSLEPLSSLPPPPRERFTGSFTKRSPAPLKYQLSPQLKLKCHTEAC